MSNIKGYIIDTPYHKNMRTIREDMTMQCQNCKNCIECYKDNTCTHGGGGWRSIVGLRRVWRELKSYEYILFEFAICLTTNKEKLTYQ